MQLAALQQRLARPIAARRSSLVVQASKGFGSQPKTAPKPDAPEPANADDKAPSTSAATSSADKDAEAVAALEARIKSRRKRAAVEAKVKVVAPAVDIATGKVPTPVEGEMERAYLGFMSAYFFGVLLLGLVLAASGFLPDEVDLWVQDSVYPAYSWIVVGFLVLSSLYGLFKVGKLPGQRQE